MAYTPFDDLQGSDSTVVSDKSQTVSLDGQEIIEVSGTEFTSDAKMTKDGHDLVLEAPDGSTVVIEGYFLADPAPMIQSPDGSVLTPELVDSFAKAPAEFAQTGGLSDESPVGAVEETSGEAHVIRTDGTIETITVGTPIYQGDIVETQGEGAVNIVFIDETSFAVSDNARLAIDEYVFDPATESGAQNFSVLRGVFVFTSGLIGRDDPDDVEIDTPVGSIGIRGTIIAGNIEPGGDSEITVIEGAIVIKNGFEETTLSQQFETVKLSGFDTAIETSGVMQPQDVSEMYGGVSDVSPTLFSSINDAMKDSAPEPQAEAQPEPQAEPQVEADVAPEGPQQSDANAPADEPVTPDMPSDPLGMMDPATNPMGNPMGADQNQFDGQNAMMGDSAPNQQGLDPLMNNNPDAGTGAPQGSVAQGPNNDPQQGQNNLSGTAADSETPPPVMNLQELLFNLNEETKDGDVVAQFKILGNQPNVVVNFGGGGNTIPLDSVATGSTLELIQNGTNATIIFKNPLDPTGEPFDDLDGVFTTNFNLVLTSQGSNLPPKVFNFNRGVSDTDFVGTPILDLNDPASAGVTIISDSGIGNQIGSSIAFGDFSGGASAGFDDLIFLDRIGTNIDNGQHYLLNGNFNIINDGTVGTVAPPVGSSVNGNNRVISNVGDVDGDGRDDFIIADNATNSVDIYASTAGNNPVTAISSGADVSLGVSVAGLGDLDNDGIDDYIVGDNLHGGGAGRVAINLSGSGVNSFFGGGAGEEFGRNVSSAGDFNGDGNLDWAIASGGIGRVDIFLNDGTGNPSGVRTFTGFSPNGNNEIPITSLGDIDGDGITDMMMASTGTDTAHIVLGNNGGGDINSVADMSFNNIVGGGAAGDFNGDGFDDFVLVHDNGTGVADINILYGGTGGIGSNGVFHMQYDTGLGNINGVDFTIEGGGDLNGDGFDDIAIGMPQIDSNGDSQLDGEVVLVYGRDDNGATVASTATANGDSVIGDRTNNTLDDSGFLGVSLRGGSSNDTFLISNDQFRSIDGGTGTDTIIAGGNLDFTNVNFEQLNGIESIQGTAGQTITLTFENLFNLLKTSGDTISGVTTLTLNGDANYVFDLASGTTGADGTDANTNGVDDDTDALAAALGGTATDTGANAAIDIGGYRLLIDDVANVAIV